MKSEGAAKLPREVAKGIWWLGSCSELNFNGRLVHNHTSCFLVIGAKKTLLIDTGYPKEWPQVKDQLLRALGGRGLDYVMPTHPEQPHAGNLPRLLEEFPEALAIGDLRNYHLFFPEIEGRLRPLPEGTVLDLGDESVVLIEAIFHDLPNTLWAYAQQRGVMFVSDGFSYLHHNAGECALTSRELSWVPTLEDTALIQSVTFYWSRYVDSRPNFTKLDRFLREHRIAGIAPAHGCYVEEPATLVPLLYEGMVGANRGSGKT